MASGKETLPADISYFCRNRDGIKGVYYKELFMRKHTSSLLRIDNDQL